jgi:hypothetical protein
MPLAEDRSVLRILDREKIEAVLKRRFPGAQPGQVAAATNALMGLGDEWEEVAPGAWWGDAGLAICEGSCYLREAAQRGAQFRVFQRIAP